MAYVTSADVYTVIPQTEVAQLTDDSTTGDLSVNTTNLDAAIANADAVINSYMRGQHTVAFTTAPPLIKSLSLDLTKVNLYRRRRSTSADGIDEGIEKIYDQAIDTLKEIAKGEILIDDSTSYANTAGMIQTNKTSSDKVYTSTEMNKYI